MRILEGYGVTETAPVLAMNTPLANRAGTVGRLSPLMEARLEPVPGITEGGRLFVRGPNVMLGYYRAENPGVLEPPADGWHDTGDIVTIDADGYINIRGRAKRFAKIAGEMVSLSAVEAMAAEIWPAALSIVVALPDARKGERLVLLTQEKAASREVFSRHASSRARPSSRCLPRSWCSSTCRCSAPASPTTSRRWRSPRIARSRRSLPATMRKKRRRSRSSAIFREGRRLRSRLVGLRRNGALVQFRCPVAGSLRWIHRCAGDQPGRGSESVAIAGFLIATTTRSCEHPRLPACGPSSQWEGLP